MTEPRLNIGGPGSEAHRKREEAIDKLPIPEGQGFWGHIGPGLHGEPKCSWCGSYDIFMAVQGPNWNVEECRACGNRCGNLWTIAL